MRAIRIKLVALICLLCACGCSDEDNLQTSDSKEWTELTVAIVLPMDNGLDAHWERTLGMFATNFERAFKNQDKGIKFSFEYYNEWSEDIQEIAENLATRTDIYAVIGGLYSPSAEVLAAELTPAGVTFFTLATAEELVRAYSSTGYLWAMTETDITQCEVLLSKVLNYGGESVALLAKEGDSYGQTFVDWFAFQAMELGLENKGVFTYDSSTLEDVTRQAVQSGAEYVICVPAETEDMGPMLEAYNIEPAEGASAPRLLFSDAAYGTDVLTVFGEKAEGIEGVAFGSDPESGFDVSYETFFGVLPTLGEAQFYDAAMLLGYAAWLQLLQPGLSLRDALRTLVTGEGTNLGSWSGEDMGLVVDALAQGDEPYIKGASGDLRFDSKVYTSVLATTYYNYMVYNGNYIILDYNTSDGSNRTEATLASWNWKASQMQEFDDSDVGSYPELQSNWALLVATSSGWTNYRHQADVLAIYQQLKASGYTDDHIVLVIEDDLAYNDDNPYQGIVRVSASGSNVYEDVTVDYHMSELSPEEDLVRILTGEKTDKLQEVISATENDNIFFFWSGHGTSGALCWGDDTYAVTSEVLAPIFTQMSEKGCYRKLLMMVEACYSGGVLEECTGLPGMLFITAANGEETSKADTYNTRLGVWMSNRFTSTFLEQISDNPSIGMSDLYYRLFINTVGSHVMVYNSTNYGSLYTSDMSEYINFKD